VLNYNPNYPLQLFDLSLLGSTAAKGAVLAKLIQLSAVRPEKRA